jgi:hypothetical protein
MHKIEFGQAYCKDLLKSILWKFTLYFSEFYSIYYEFLKFILILGILKWKNDFWKILNEWTLYGLNLARAFATAARARVGFGWNVPGHSVWLGTRPGLSPCTTSTRWRGRCRQPGRRGEKRHLEREWVGRDQLARHDHRVESSPR